LVSFKTKAPAPPTGVDPERTLDVGEGAADATWSLAETDASYRLVVDTALQDGLIVDEFIRGQYCHDAAGAAAGWE
jgi:hypothetical protein